MISVNHRFIGVTSPAIIGRISKSQDIVTINRGDRFEAVNLKNGHRYDVHRIANTLVCVCPDSKRGHECKHEIASLRDLQLFDEV